MTYPFRKPPKLDLPETSQWEGVFKLPDNIEIWFLNLRLAANGFYPVFCNLIQDRPVPQYTVPLSRERLISDPRIIRGWGNKFFWSQSEKTLVVQLLQTFDYAERSETEQLFLAGQEFTLTQTLTGKDVVLLPNKKFKEVFPEMFPNR